MIPAGCGGQARGGNQSENLVAGEGETSINKIESHFDKIGIKRKIPKQLKQHLNTSQFIEAMSSDKKVKNKKINLILCKSIGEAYITDTFKHKNMKKVIKDFLN